MAEPGPPETVTAASLPMNVMSDKSSPGPSQADPPDSDNDKVHAHFHNDEVQAQMTPHVAIYLTVRI